MRTQVVIVLLLFEIVIGRLARAEEGARPPEWPHEVQDVYFDDARDQLNGRRPDYEQAGSLRSGSLPQGAADAAAVADEFAWSELVDATTLETEIKRLSQSLDATITNPSAFKSGGFKTARRDFNELAVLFAVVGQFDGDARWKDVAAGWRDQFAQAGRNTKAGGDQTYREAVDRKNELTELVRGSRPQVAEASASVDDWSQVAARPPLMRRLETAHDERLTKWLADATTFRRNRDAVRHEAQIVAMLAEVIHRKEFEYWDDESFAEYAIELRNAATATVAAADAGNFEQARDAVNRATGACTDCHAGYRG